MSDWGCGNLVNHGIIVDKKSMADNQSPIDSFRFIAYGAAVVSVFF